MQWINYYLNVFSFRTTRKCRKGNVSSWGLSTFQGRVSLQETNFARYNIHYIIWQTNKICIFFIPRQIYWYFVWLKMIFCACKSVVVKWPQHRVQTLTRKQSPCVQRIASISIVTTARVQGSPGLVVHRAGVAVVWHNSPVSGSVSRGQHQPLHCGQSEPSGGGGHCRCCSCSEALPPHHHRCVKCDVTTNTVAAAPVCSDHHRVRSRDVLVMLV